MSCGTNLEEVAFQSVTALGRTTVDGWLTEVTNNIANAREPVVTDGELDQDGGSDEDGDMDSGNGDSDADDADPNDDANPNGDDGGTDSPGSLDGATIVANICSACHGSDGASGFAPNIRGKTVDEILEAQTRDVHASITVTDEDVAAIAAFLSE